MSPFFRIYKSTLSANDAHVCRQVIGGSMRPWWTERVHLPPPRNDNDNNNKSGERSQSGVARRRELHCVSADRRSHARAATISGSSPRAVHRAPERRPLPHESGAPTPERWAEARSRHSRQVKCVICSDIETRYRRSAPTFCEKRAAGQLQDLHLSNGSLSNVGRRIDRALAQCAPAARHRMRVVLVISK